jgi:hypothetical protein
MYICDFSRSVGDGSATTRKTRGLTRSVSALIVPPLPAPSRPSKTMQTLRPLWTTHSCSFTSSTWSFLSAFSYSLVASGASESPAVFDDACRFEARVFAVADSAASASTFAVLSFFVMALHRCREDVACVHASGRATATWRDFWAVGVDMRCLEQAPCANGGYLPAGSTVTATASV